MRSLWQEPIGVLSVEQAEAAAVAVTEAVRYRKHFPFVVFRGRAWAAFDHIGIWQPRDRDDRQTLYAHVDAHEWLRPLEHAIRMSRANRTSPAYDPNFASVLALKPGEVFPAHQDFGRTHKRSVLALSSTAEIQLIDIGTGDTTAFDHVPGQQYEMQISDDELLSVMHKVTVGSEASRQAIVL